MTDTPRWLASKDRYTEALATLARLRGTDSSDATVREEFEAIEAQRREKVADLAGTSLKNVIKEIATVPTYRSRYLLVLFMQTVAQWSGGNGITYYIPQIFQYAGIKGESSSLISSGAYGIVKLVFTMVFAWGLIDVIGRRRCFLAGLGCQLAAHVYMAVYMSLQPSVASNKSASDAAIASVFIYAVGWVSLFTSHARVVHQANVYLSPSACAQCNTSTAPKSSRLASATSVTRPAWLFTGSSSSQS